MLSRDEPPLHGAITDRACCTRAAAWSLLTGPSVHALRPDHYWPGLLYTRCSLITTVWACCTRAAAWSLLTGPAVHALQPGHHWLGLLYTRCSLVTTDWACCTRAAAWSLSPSVVPNGSCWSCDCHREGKCWGRVPGGEDSPNWSLRRGSSLYLSFAWQQPR
jgi:hypothetical protein